MEKLQEEAESGSKKVAELHQQLSRCQQELSQCLAQVEGMDEDHEKEVVSLRHQVGVVLLIHVEGYQPSPNDLTQL